MKQRITVNQLNEMTDQQKWKLQEWWTPNLYDVVCSVDGQVFCAITAGSVTNNLMDHKGNHLPLLSIGQMIDLLHSASPIEMINDTPSGDLMGTWYVTVRDRPDLWRHELCDALWEAVKYAL